MSSGCGDVLSLADLQTAKKHQLFEAEVITGKQGGIAGGSDIDYATNLVTGQVQKTMPAVLRDIGFEPASFDFSTGGTLGANDRNKVVYDPVSKTWYSWGGALPHVIAAGTNPVGIADWHPQTDHNLRADLAATTAGKGADMIGVPPASVSWAARTQNMRNLDYRNAKDAGAGGVGGDDTVALQRYADYLATLSIGLTPPYAPPVMDIPPGEYGITAPIRFTQAVHIRAKGVRIKALPGFTASTVNLQAGGTEQFHGMFLFLNGNKGADSGQGLLRFNVTIDEGLVLDCQDIAYPNIYMERFVNSSINCTLQSSVHAGLVVGPSSWGLNTENLIVENFADAAIQFLERSAVNGAKLNVRIWGNFKEGLSGIQFDSESACNGVLITGFIEKIKYGIIAGRSTGPVSVSGVDFEQCRFSVVRAAGDMSDGRQIGPISLNNCFAHSIDATKFYAEGAVITVEKCRMEFGASQDFETDATRTGLILHSGCQFAAGGPKIVAGSNVRGKVENNLSTVTSNYSPKNTATFSDTHDIRNYEWTGYPLTQTSGYSFSSRLSSGDNRDYGRALWWTSDRTATTVQTITGVTLATDNAVRYFGPMLDNLISCGGASARFSVIYAATGTINTSDVREKQQQRLLEENEKAAALAIKSSIKAFKRNDEVGSKGYSAKWHFGVMAQEVRDILIAHGLNPELYEFLVYEEWDAREPIIKDGLELQPAVGAGNRWGIKYEQLLCFIIASL